MKEETQASFYEGQKVTYGNHGICTVVGDEDGQYGPMIVIRLGNGVLTQVPRAKAVETLKPIETVSPIADVIATLKRPTKKSTKSWNQKEREYAAVLGTQDALALAAMVADLHPRDKAVGLESHQLYQAALYQLVELLRIAENTDVPTILKKLQDGTELKFRADDAKPSTYAARSRSSTVKPPPAKEPPLPQVRLSSARPVAALPRPALAPKPVVEKPVVPKAPPATRPVEKPAASVPVVAATPAQKKLPLVAPVATPPVLPKIATPQILTPASLPPVVVAAPRVEPEPRAVVPPRAKHVEPPVVQRPVDTEESAKLRETIVRLEAENKTLRQTAATVTSLTGQLETARLTIRNLRTQLTDKDTERETANRTRQQRDREQKEREMSQLERIKQLDKLLGVMIGTAQLFASAWHEKMIVPPVVQTVVGPSKSGELEEDTKEILRQARRMASLRKGQIDTLKGKLATARADLKAANSTIDKQAAKLANNDVTVLLQALVTRKEEIDALSAIIKDANKEVKRLTLLVGARDKTIENLRERVLTADQVRANIAKVRDELLQLIRQRTEAVERCR